MPERREEILEIAKQIFARQGVKSTTVRQIGSEVGVLSGSLYHHFDSKLDMVDAILAEFCEFLTEGYERIASASSPPTERLRDLVRQGFQIIAQRRAEVLIFQREAESLGAEERFAYLRTTEKRIERLWLGVIAEGQATGEFRADCDARMTYRLLRDIIASSVRWHRSGSVADADVTSSLMDIVYRGIATRGTRRRGG